MFSHRINNVPRSFLREILKKALQPEIISFAGGLPNKDLFPLEELTEATNKVLKDHGSNALQYTVSEGYAPLREWVAARYNKQGLNIHADNILITTGSQQGLDLLGKVLINDGDPVAIEEPGFFGAIQALTIYQARWLGVPVNESGADIEHFKFIMDRHQPKAYYCVPNFQNPSGISYSETNRQQLAQIVEATDTMVIEDDPYGELRFKGTPCSLFRKILPRNTVLLGTSSKMVSPSFRIGWLVAEGELMEKLLIAKQAADLHTPYFSQIVLHQYLTDNCIEEQIKKISQSYGEKCEQLLVTLKKSFPEQCRFTEPDGGMFLWMTLPNGTNSMSFFNQAIKNNVAFVPGNPFFHDERNNDSLRLSFSCSSPEEIEEGVKRLAQSYQELME